MSTRKFIYVDSNGDYIETSGAYEISDFSSVSAANAPVKLDASGLLGSALIKENRIDHDLLYNFSANEHLDWTQAAVGTIHASNYVDNDTTYVSSDFDHDQLTNFEQSEHFTVGSINHSSISITATDEHQEYILANGTRAFTATVIGVAPTQANHLATKEYVDGQSQGLKPKEAVRVATTASILLSTDAGDTIDGITLAEGDRLLVKDQATADKEQNGIYDVKAAGSSLVRSSDFDSLTPVDEINGAYVPVQEGTENAGKFYVQSGTVTTLGTDDINFVYFNSLTDLSAGNGIDSAQLASNTIQLDLLADGGLKFVGTEVGVEASDIAGDGLVDDGSDNLAIDWATSSTDAKALKASTLSATTNGDGAALVGIEDVGGYFDGATVESALAEIGADLAGGVGGIDYTAGTGGVSVGDAVYVSAANTATVYGTITNAEAVIGLATASVAQGQTFKVAANDTLLASVVSGATPGNKYYWNGTGWQTSLPSTSGQYIWLGGVAKNTTDIHVDVMFIKRNT